MTVNNTKSLTTFDNASSSNAKYTSPPNAVNSSSTSVSVFKKPATPSQLQRVAGTKPEAKSKPLIEDVDMKSASSICSMDVTNVIDLTQETDADSLKSNVVSLPKPVKKVSRTPAASSVGIITVQVMQDSVVDLTGADQTNCQDEGKKSVVKQNKETEKPATKKKTTISEDTKMKIRDSIFANMFAKQKGYLIEYILVECWLNKLYIL